MTREDEINQAKLLHENRRLRESVNDLLDELEQLPQVDVSSVKRKIPDRPQGDDTPNPPWEREGYESKQAWLEDK